MADHIYVVKAGDSLSKIAKEFYGDAKRWKEIYEANKDKIKNPDVIHPGQELRIPGVPAETAASQMGKATLRHEEDEQAAEGKRRSKPDMV